MTCIVSIIVRWYDRNWIPTYNSFQIYCQSNIWYLLYDELKFWTWQKVLDKTKGDKFVHDISEIWMDVALNTITLTLFTFIFKVQYFLLYCSLQTSPMQAMCCSDRVVFFCFLFIFLLFTLIFRTEKHIYFNNTREVPSFLF